MSYTSEVLADTPWGFWPLTEPTGVTTYDDASPNARDLTIAGTAPESVAGPAVGFTGQQWTTAAGSLTTSAGASQPSTVTYSVWVRVDSYPAAETGVIAFGGFDVYGPTSALTLTAAGHVKFFLYAGSNQSITASAPLTTGVWHHVVCKVGAGGAKIRVNKVDVAASSLTSVSSYVLGNLHVRSDGPQNTSGTGAMRLAGAAAWTSRISDARTDAHYDAMGVAATLLGTVSEVDAVYPVATPADSGVSLGVAPEVATAGALAVSDGSVAVALGVVSESSVASPLALTDAPAFTRDDITSGRNRTGIGYASWLPAVDPTPAALVGGTQVDKALAFSPVTIVGTQPTFDVTEAETPRHRDRVIVGGRDVTYFRGAETQVGQFQLLEPFGYGTATLTFPQVYPDYEAIGTGELGWLKPGKRVLIQRVDAAGNVVATDYKGYLIAPNANTGSFSYEVGGQLTGPASLRYRPQPLFRRTSDIGKLLWQAVAFLGARSTPRLGVDTGIEIGRIGGMPFLDYMQQIIGRAWTRNGNQWTVMPNDQGVYEVKRKDRTTIAGTVYLSASSVEADLRRDISEEPNRVFATGVTPEGQRVQFGRYPGLDIKPTMPTFPGFMSEGSTGDGVLTLTRQLQVHGYLDATTAPGGYDADVVKAVEAVQEDAEITVTGNVNETTWEALFDNEKQGVSLKLARIEPAAQRSYTKKYRTSPSGAIIGRNPNYDPTRLKIDRDVDFGAGFKRSQQREWSKAEIVDGAEPNWVGTLTIHSGAVVAGEHAPGDPITGVLPARDIRPGMNLWLPQFDEGIVVHVSAATVNGAVVTLQVDTRARDAWNVAQVIERDRESRKDPARAFFRRLGAATIQKDAIGEWSEVGGLINDQTIRGGQWNVFATVGGQAGTVQKIRLNTNPNAESSVAVFGKRVWPGALQRIIGNPLTQEGTDRWRDEAKLDKLRDDHGLLYSAGDVDQPGGYSPGYADDTAIITGRVEDDGGFSYHTDNRPILYVAVWADRDCVIPGGRIMWPQLEAGA